MTLPYTAITSPYLSMRTRFPWMNWTRGHELSTFWSARRNANLLFCDSCGDIIREIPLSLMLKPEGALFSFFERVVRDHILITLDELAEWGWFDAEASA